MDSTAAPNGYFMPGYNPPPSAIRLNGGSYQSYTMQCESCGLSLGLRGRCFAKNGVCTPSAIRGNSFMQATP